MRAIFRYNVTPFRRSAASLILGTVALAVLTLICLKLQFTRAGAELVYLIVVVFVSVAGGFTAAVCTSIFAVACLAYFLSPAVFAGSVTEKVNVVELVVFVAAAFVIGRLVVTARRRERDLRLIMDGVPALVMVDSVEESIDSYCNQRLLDYTGLSLEELRRRGWESILHPDDVVTNGAEQPSEREVRLRDAHGGYRWFLNRVVPMRDASGLVTGRCTTSSDIDDRKRAEETLRHAQDDLARVTRVTTMGELVASIAHEVNQPLAAVVTNANASLRWLAATPPNLDEVRQATVRIIADGNRASDVVARIRALLAKKEPAREPVMLDEVIGDVVALTRAEAQRNGTLVQLDLSDRAVVLADRVQLQQVLMNLVLNGMEAMNGVTGRAKALTIQTRPHESGGVFVAVRDTGAGISAEDLPHIFDAFYTTKSGGLGMGLAIGRSIIESHGGRIWATSETAGGSTFQFTLPAAGAEAS